MAWDVGAAEVGLFSPLLFLVRDCFCVDDADGAAASRATAFVLI